MDATPNADDAPPERPYPGLRPFRPNENLIFFGRDEQIDEVVKRLNNNRFVAIVGTSGCGKSSLLNAGVVPELRKGMARAGSRWAVASMHPGDRPMIRLAEALLDPKVLGTEWADVEHPLPQIVAMLRRGPLGLVEVLRETPPPEGRKLLLLVDQFEEIFRYRNEGEAQREEAAAFVALLLATIHEPDSPAYVILAMRSDYLGDCAIFERLPEAFNSGQYLVPKLNRAQCGLAVERPALVFDGRVEPELVARLLNDMGAGPDQLPLLQHALMRLWKSSSGSGAMTLADFERDVKSIGAALSDQADAAYLSLGDADRRIAEILFRRLSERTTTGREIRRPTRVREIAAVAEVDPAVVVAVVDVFRDPDRCFLTPAAPAKLGPDDYVDIGHESLIRNWKRLRDWVVDERDRADAYLRYEQSARLWLQNRSDLLGLNETAQARLWRDDTKPNAAWASRYGGDFQLAVEFIKESEDEFDRLHAEHAKRKAETVARDLRMAELAREKSRLLTVGVWILTAFLFLTFWLTVLAWTQWDQASTRSRENKRLADAAALAARKATENEARAVANENLAKEQTRIARSRQLAALSTAEREMRIDLALLLAVEGLRAENTFEARDALYKALHQRPGLKKLIPIDNGPFQGDSIGWTYRNAGLPLALSPDGSTIAVGRALGVQLRDRATGRLMCDFPLPREGAVTSLAFSPDGKRLAGGYHGGIRLWEVQAGQLVPRPAPTETEDVVAIAFTHDGHKLVAVFRKSRNGGVALWGTSEWKLLARLPLGDGTRMPTGLAVSPDCKGVAVSYWSTDALEPKRGGGVVEWDTLDLRPETARTYGVPEARVNSVGYSPEGRLLAAGYDEGGFGGGVEVWSGKPGERKPGFPIRLKEGTVRDVAFDPSGTSLLVGLSGLGRERISAVFPWPGVGEDRTSSLSIIEGQVGRFVTGPKGILAVSYSDPQSDRYGVLLWDRSRPDPLGRFVSLAGGGVADVAVGPDGRVLALGVNDGVESGVFLWDLERGRWLLDRPLRARGKAVSGVAFSPDGKLLAASVEGEASKALGGVELWDSSGGEWRRREAMLTVDKGTVRDVAFSPDGSVVAAGYGEPVPGSGGITLWRTTDGGRRGTALVVEDGAVGALAFQGSSLIALAELPKERFRVVSWDWAMSRRTSDFSPPVSSVGRASNASLAVSARQRRIAVGVSLLNPSSTTSGVLVLPSPWDSVSKAVYLNLGQSGAALGRVDVSYDPGGKWLATSTGVGTILWDAASLEKFVDPPLFFPSTHPQGACALTPDGKTLVVASHLGFVLWNLDLDDWTRVAGEIANRNFTPDEWRRYFPGEPHRATFRDLPLDATRAEGP